MAGSLGDTESLRDLASGADSVIHVAGVLSAPTEAGFEAGNVTGTQSMLDAAKDAGVKRFIHVSSLAAREPTLSMYGASKARSEERVQSSALDWSIVRPPAIYGPGDRETLELFQMANRGFVLLPPGGRLSLIHVDDLADLLLALAEPLAPTGRTIEPDDGAPNGFTHVEFASMLGKAVGTTPRTFSAPAALIHAAARIDGWLRGAKAKLTPDRASYFCHPDWVVSPDRSASPSIWAPRIPTHQGLKDTANWYRDAGWL